MNRDQQILNNFFYTTQVHTNLFDSVLCRKQEKRQLNTGCRTLPEPPLTRYTTGLHSGSPSNWKTYRGSSSDLITMWTIALPFCPTAIHPIWYEAGSFHFRSTFNFPTPIRLLLPPTLITLHDGLDFRRVWTDSLIVVDATLCGTLHGSMWKMTLEEEKGLESEKMGRRAVCEGNDDGSNWRVAK